MSPRTGRPKSDNAKGQFVGFRLDDEDIRQLDECCESRGLTRSELIRTMIREEYAKQQNK